MDFFVVFFFCLFFPTLPKQTQQPLARRPLGEAWLLSRGSPWSSGEPVVQVSLGTGRVRVGFAQHQAVPEQLEEGIVVAEEDEGQGDGLVPLLRGH